MRNNVGSYSYVGFVLLDARYEFFSTLDGRDSNNRYLSLLIENHLHAYSSTAIERRAHPIGEIVSRKFIWARRLRLYIIHSKTLCNRSACISFHATCVERVSPNRAVNPTTGLVSRIGEGSGLKHLSRVRDRRRVNEYVTRTLRHVLRLDLVTSISLYFHAKEIYKAMMHCYYTDACQSSHVFAEKN